MLQYIIDGYNVVHRLAEIKNSSHPCLELVAFIKRNQVTGSKNNKVCVVFDGGPKDGLRSDEKFHVAFSLDRSADDYIKDKISLLADNDQVIVVSNDRQIQDFARECKVKIMSADDFLAKADPKPLPRNSRIETNIKKISPRDQEEITRQMRDIWLNKKTDK